MMRRTTSSRPASWERGQKEMHVAQKCEAFRPLADTIEGKTLALDDSNGLSAMLREAAFDALGAARWLDGRNPSFARAAIASAITELRTVAERLEVDA